LKVQRDHLRLIHPLRVFLPLLLPVVERGHGHLGVLRVGVVDGLGAVPQSLPGKALGIAALESALGPSVAAGMEGHAFDLEPEASLLEFGGAVASADGA
jgi:hypothetical protein